MQGGRGETARAALEVLPLTATVTPAKSNHVSFRAVFERIFPRPHFRLHQTEQQLEEFGDKVPAADKEAIETALSELKEVKDGEDLEAIQQKTQALVQAAMKLGEAMYAAQQAEGGDAEASGDDDVVDAEFSEVDDDAKKDA